MPRIQPIISEVAASGGIPTRQATGADFGAGIGQALMRVGAEGEQVSLFLKQKETQDDVSNVRMEMAKARADWSVQFAERKNKADPNDPNFANQFTADITSYLDKGRDVATTRAGQRTYDMLATEMRGQFAEQSFKFQSDLAGVKAVNDFTASANLYGSSLLTDPTQYGQVLAQAMSDINDPNGRYAGIPAKNRGELTIKLKDVLAKSYVQGLIANGAGELARNILMSGRLDSELNPADKNTLISGANQAITADRVAAEHAQVLAAKQEKERIAGINNDLMGKFVAGKLNVADIRGAGLPAFGDGSQHTWVSMLKAQSKEWAERPVKTDPRVLRDLFERANLPDGDPRKITDLKPVADAYIGQKLSTADMEHASKWIVDARTDSGQKLGQAQSQFLAGMKGSLDKSTLSSIDKGGGERFYNFQAYVNDQVKKAREAKENPYELFNPSSPKYLGKAVPQFQVGAQRMATDIADTVNRALDPANRRQPGETPTQYLERTKKK